MRASSKRRLHQRREDLPQAVQSCTTQLTGGAGVGQGLFELPHVYTPSTVLGQLGAVSPTERCQFVITFYLYVGKIMYYVLLYAENEQCFCGCTPLGCMIVRVRLYVPVPQVALHDSQTFHCPIRLSEVCICSTHISSMPISPLQGRADDVFVFRWRCRCTGKGRAQTAGLLHKWQKLDSGAVIKGSGSLALTV